MRDPAVLTGFHQEIFSRLFVLERPTSPARVTIRHDLEILVVTSLRLTPDAACVRALVITGIEAQVRGDVTQTEVYSRGG